MTTVAVAHANWGTGGGEVVAAELARALDADLYYSYEVNHSGGPPEDIESTQIKPQRDTVANSALLRDLDYFATHDCIPEFTEYDVLVISGNEYGWYVPPDNQAVVRYCHSPPRTAFDRYHEKMEGRRGVSRLLTKGYSLATRVLYQHTVPYADVWMANSDLVAYRLQKYFGVDEDDIRVVYPPVDVDEYSQSAETEPDQYLAFGRLEENKNIDDIVLAFASYADTHGDGEKPRLIVGGDGSQREKIEEMVADTPYVEYRGYLSTDEKHSLLESSEAVIVNYTNEDFGIVPIEAWASGTPVIAPDEGFAQYQVKPGVNGVLSPDTSVAGVYEGIRGFRETEMEWGESELARFAEQFSTDRFTHDVREAVQYAVGCVDIQPEIDFELPEREVVSQ